LCLLIFRDNFTQLEMFLEQATTLKSLTISSNIEALIDTGQ
jgi:hypothetical protein